MAGLSGMLRLDSAVLDRLRDEPGLIIAANHPSMLDALILVARLPRGACIMKAELMRNIFLGAGARLARYIRNDSALCMVRLAVQDLRDGGQLVIFPEGTRTTQRPVNPFTSAAPLISKLADAPIQTVFIDTDSPYLGKGWPLWRLPPLPIASRSGSASASPRRPMSMHSSSGSERYFAANVRSGAPAAPQREGPHSEDLVGMTAPRSFGPVTSTANRAASASHLVLIPSYNTGAKLLETVRDACAQWNPVWVVIDGSTDGSAEAVQRLAETEPACA